MTDYAKNLQDFYGRDDYALLAGQQGETAIEARFKELTYIPRKTTPLPGLMAEKMLKEFAVRERSRRRYICIFPSAICAAPIAAFIVIPSRRSRSRNMCRRFWQSWSI